MADSDDIQKVRTRCPTCLTGYNVSPAHLGKRTRCKKCSEIFTISPVSDPSLWERPDPSPVIDGEPYSGRINGPEPNKRRHSEAYLTTEASTTIISTHDELSACLNEIADNPPRFTTVFIRPKSKNWPTVKSLCINNSKMTVEVDAKTLLATWSGDDSEMGALGEVLELAKSWESFSFFHEGNSCGSLHRFDWISCYAEYLKRGDEAYCCRPSVCYGGVLSTTEGHDCILPCKLLLIGWSEPSSLPLSSHVRLKVESAAESRGVFRCPNYSTDRFKVASQPRSGTAA